MPDHFRPSELNRVQACPGFRVLRERVQGQPTAAMERGTLGHAIVAGVLTDGGSPGTEDPDLARDVDAALAWAEPLGAPVVVERLYSVEIDGVTMSPKVDAVWTFEDCSALIVDWKFGPNIDNPAPEDDWQLRAYAHAIWSVDKDTIPSVVAGRLHVCKGAVEWVPLVLDSIDLLVDNSERLADLLAEIRDREDFVVGPHCTRCYLRGDCEAFADRAQLVRLDAESPITQDNAGELVVTIAAARDWLDDLEDKVKGFVRDGGEVTWGGKVWVRSFRGKADRYDAPAVFAALEEEIGDGVMEAISVSKSSISEAMWKAGKTPEEIKDFLAMIKDYGWAVTQDRAEVFGWKTPRTPKAGK